MLVNALVKLVFQTTNIFPAVSFVTTCTQMFVADQTKCTASIISYSTGIKDSKFHNCVYMKCMCVSIHDYKDDGGTCGNITSSRFTK